MEENLQLTLYLVLMVKMQELVEKRAEEER